MRKTLRKLLVSMPGINNISYLLVFGNMKDSVKGKYCWNNNISMEYVL